MAQPARRRLPSGRRPRTALLAAAAVLVAVSPFGPAALAADHPVFPSRSAVDASKAQAASTADQVGQIEAQLAAASTRADRLATEVAQAVEAYNGARVRLDAAVAKAEQAQRDAAEAAMRELAGRLQNALERYADQNPQQHDAQQDGEHDGEHHEDHGYQG